MRSLAFNLPGTKTLTWQVRKRFPDESESRTATVPVAACRSVSGPPGTASGTAGGGASESAALQLSLPRSMPVPLVVRVVQHK